MDCRIAKSYINLHNNRTIRNHNRIFKINIHNMFNVCLRFHPPRFYEIDVNFEETYKNFSCKRKTKKKGWRFNAGWVELHKFSVLRFFLAPEIICRMLACQMPRFKKIFWNKKNPSAPKLLLWKLFKINWRIPQKN